jgi:hypothetical protein
MGYFSGNTLSGTGGSTITVGTSSTFTLDEGYVTFSNFAKSPVYVKAGKFYENFGHYNAYAAVPSLTQFFEQVQGTGAEVGYAGANGFFANVAGFGGSNTSVNTTTNRSNIDNWDINAGYAGNYNGAAFDVKLGFLSNESDLAWRNSADYTSNLGAATVFANNSSVFAANANVMMNKFNAGVNFARFNKDISLTGGTTATINKPWALDINAGYAFNTAGYGSHVGISYQMTRNAGWLYLPKTRYGADYTLDFSKNVDFSLAYYHDKAYGNTTADAFNNNGNLSTNNLFMGRVSVSF